MNESEKDAVREKKTKTGFGLRITQAIIYTLGLVGMFTGMLISSLQWSQNLILESYNIISLSQWLVVVIISWLVAFLGKKYRWANIICIIVNGSLALALIGLVGLIGGIKGLKSIPKKQKVKAVSHTSEVTAKAEAGVLSSGTEEIKSEVQPEAQGVQAQLKAPNKKADWILFGIMTAYYLFLLVFGILSMLMPDKGLAWGPYDDLDYTVAMNVITGFILILLVPSYGYYLACKAPFRIGKKGSIIIFALSIVLTVIGDVLFYILMGEQLSFVSFTMKFAPVLAEVGLIAIYVMGFFRTVTEKQADSQDAQGGNTKGGFANVISKILRCSNSAWFIFGGTVLFSLCLFVLIELLYALLCIAIILFIVALFRSFTVGSGGHSNVYYVTDDTGSTRTLQYDRYNSFSGEDIYKDDVGGEWATKDRGSTFYSI